MGKKIAIGCGSIIGVVAAAVLIFYVGWLIPPDAEEVCDNVIRLSSEARPDASEQALAALRVQCIEGATTRPQYGKMPWVTSLKCQRDAASVEELRACTQ